MKRTKSEILEVLLPVLTDNKSEMLHEKRDFRALTFFLFQQRKAQFFFPRYN